MTAAPAPPRELTIAVLGARDSAAPAVASALSAAAGTALSAAAGTALSAAAGTALSAAAGTVLSAAAGPAADAGARIRVLVDASPEDRPDAAVLVVDAVCPVRPDDVEVARGVAARLPMAVAVAGRAHTCTAEHLSETVDVTTRRLVDAGVDCPVHVVDDAHPGAPAALLSSLLAAVRAGSVPAAPRGPGPRPAGPDPATATVDWLLARRTEAITTRSQALRQDVQALRMEVVQDLHRSVRDLGGRAREELAAAPRSRVDALVHRLAADADAAVAATVARADRRADALVARHLGSTAPTGPRIPVPTSGLTPGRPPRNTGEELLVMITGAAGGTGVGRMLLAPLAEVPGAAALVIPLALLCGVALGWVTVTVRRTQALRTHTVAAVGDRLAALRAETEQSLGSRILAAEATITDGFAHDPGPRVTDLERRIRRMRTEQAARSHTTAGGTSP